MAEPIIIDTHLHLFRDREEGLRIKEALDLWEYGPKKDVRFSNYAGDIQDALHALRKAGVEKAVLVNFYDAPDERKKALAGLPEYLNQKDREDAARKIETGLGIGLKESNYWACAIAKKHPEIVTHINVDPNLLYVDDMIRHIEAMVDNGARGIKIHPTHQRFHLNDERMVKILKYCVELDLPIISHSGPDPENANFADPRAFAKILEIIPDLRLILAHLGGGTWWQLLEFSVNHPTVCFDCSEILEWTGSSNGPSDIELAQLIDDIGSEKVMMGSDFPWYDIDHNVQRVLELPILSMEQKEAILGANAVRILNL